MPEMNFDLDDNKISDDSEKTWVTIDIENKDVGNEDTYKKETEVEDKSKETEELSWSIDEVSDELDELDKLLSELDDWDVSDAVKNVEDAGNITPEVQKLIDAVKAEKDWMISELKESVNNLQLKIKSLMNDKSDLTYKNAELEAFGWVTDPDLMIVVRNYPKAKWWDKVAQDKLKRILSDMYSWVYWIDLEKEDIDNKINDLTEISSYNSKKNPNIDMKEKENVWFSV